MWTPRLDDTHHLRALLAGSVQLRMESAYLNTTVEKHPTCISHLLPITDKQIDADGALLKFETPIEITPKISYQEIQRLVDQG